MLNGSSKYVICKEIRYKTAKFHYNSPIRDLKSVRFIRRFIITEFVITIK